MRTLAYRVLTLYRAFSNFSKRRYASNEDKKTRQNNFYNKRRVGVNSFLKSRRYFSSFIKTDLNFGV